MNIVNVILRSIALVFTLVLLILEVYFSILHLSLTLYITYTGILIGLIVLELIDEIPEKTQVGFFLFVGFLFYYARGVELIISVSTYVNDDFFPILLVQGILSALTFILLLVDFILLVEE